MIKYPNIFTARKQSLGQGNVFTHICHPVHRGVCRRPLGRHPPPWTDTPFPGTATEAGGTHLLECILLNTIYAGIKTK